MNNCTLTLIESHKCQKGVQQVYEHVSDSLRCKMRFAIFLPAAAVFKEPCPVLYYLSGLTCTEQNVINKGGYERFAQRYDMIVVCPDTSPRGDNVPDDERYWVGQGAGFYINATQAPWSENYRMREYIVDELPEVIANNFPTNGLQSITGHSMGGFGALSIGLSHPEKYASISAFSPIVSPMNSGWGKDVLPLYLGNDELAWKQVDPCELVKTAAEYRPILIDQGTDDEFLAEHLKTELFEVACEAAGYPAEINMREGYDHSYFFVRTFIINHFVFHAEHLDSN